MRSTNKPTYYSSRLTVALLTAVAIGLAVHSASAGAAPNSHKRVEATDSCREIGEIRVRSGWWVDSIQLICRDELKPRRGGAGGGLHVFKLQRGEYVTGMSGRRKGPAGEYVYALQIHTNLRSSPVYGEAGRHRGSKPFQLKVKKGHYVTGISTRSGRYLEKINLRTKKIPYDTARNGVIGHECRNIAEVRVNQTWWGSEIKIICRENRYDLRTNSTNRHLSYRPVAPRHHDGRYVSRNQSGRPGYVVYRRQ